MRFVDNIRGPWARRFAVAAIAAALLPGVVGLTGGSATAGAFSRPGLPVEYLMVPSPSMGRDIKVQFQGGGPRPRSTCSTAFVPGTTSTAGTSRPRRSSGTTSRACRWSCRSAVSPASTPTGISPRAARAGCLTYKWETFLTSELPQWLAANKDVSADRQRRGRSVDGG